VSEEPGQEPQVRLDAPGEKETGQGTNPMQTLQPGPEGDPQVTRTGRRALWLGIIAMVMAIVVAYLGVVMAIVALYVGIRTLRTARRTRSRAPGAVPGIVLASIALVISIIGMAFQIFFWNELQTYSKCMSAANTISDEHVCKDTFARDFEKKLHLPKGSFKGSSYL
jgi:heme/copper-type cytochrome/quinol oxidase subunit 2